ncbi:hypothetical protein [Streptomyces sp. NPDC007369]|uniref:hypothetical protein n=1 Tax=Streptomyces sp. NPDC007369 TaxID=3154589 RepID=UPI00340800A8
MATIDAPADPDSSGSHSIPAEADRPYIVEVRSKRTGLERDSLVGVSMAVRVRTEKH